MPNQIDYYNLEETDVNTWDLIGTGRTKGIFQCEGYLGSKYGKALKPENLEHISALVSIIRPGVSQIKIEGKTLTDLYCARKNNQEPNTPLLPALQTLLAENHQIMIYQEDAIKIAREIAGFDLKQADILRKSIGTKDPEIMASLEEQFIDGCKRIGKVNPEEAKQIFGWIRESQKYSFNKCLHHETPIDIKDRGTIQIKDVKIGDKVACPMSNIKILGSSQRINTYTEVTGIHINNKKNLFKIITENDLVLRCTIDHKLLCEDKYGNLGLYPLYEILTESYNIVTSLGLTKISDIEFIGAHYTYDLQVENDNHIYYANQIAVSNSHGIGYGKITYWTAYVKKHYPLIFYTAWLNMANDKIDPKQETKELVDDAVLNGIYVKLPTLIDFKNKGRTDFYIDGNNIIFGLKNIKGVGENTLTTIKEQLNTIPINSWTYFLLNIKLTSNVFKNLISVGVFDNFGISRKRMLFEHSIWQKINTVHVKNILLRQWNKLEDALQELAGYCQKSVKNNILEYIESLRNPPYSMTDSVKWIREQELEILGCNLTDSVVSLYEGDTTCGDFLDGKTGKMSFTVEVVAFKEHVTKDKNTIAFVTVKDVEQMNCIIFSDKLEQYKNLFYVGNRIAIFGFRSKKDSLVIEVARQI